MVIVHLLYGLEVNDSFHFGLVFVCSGECKQDCSGTNSTDQSSVSASKAFRHSWKATSLLELLLSHILIRRFSTRSWEEVVTHLRSRWASCDSGRRQTSVSSRSWSCRPFWPGILDRFYQWWPDESRRLGCVQLPRYGREDQSRLSLQGGSASAAGTMETAVELQNRRKHCVLLHLRSIYMTSVVNLFFFSDLNLIHCEYLRSLFLPELHFSLYESLSPARLLLQSFLQFFPSPALLLQSLPAHLHLTLLHRCGCVWEAITSINKQTHSYTQ